MKKLLLVLSIILTACAPAFLMQANAPLSTPAPVATYPPEVCSFLATAQAGCPVTNPVTATPQPLPATSSPTPTVSPSPTVTATPDDSCTFSDPFFVRVMPFAVGSNNWNIYIPDYPKPPAIPYGYPATLFLQYFLNMKSFLMDTMYINLSSNWLQAMITVNGNEWNYLVSGSDGTFFNGTKLGVDTFPGNVLHIVGQTFKKGQCWDQVDSLAYKDNYPIDLSTVSPWFIGHQTNMRYNEPGQVFQNGIEDVPILFQPKESTDVVSAQYQGLWVPDSEVEAFPQIPESIVLTTDVNVHSSCDTTSPVIDQITSGTQVTLTDYSPSQSRTFGVIINPNNGKIGCISLFYWPSYGVPLYTSTWRMQTYPTPE